MPTMMTGMRSGTMMQTEIGSALAEVRERAKMTQSEVAKSLNLNQSRISRIESGESGTTIADCQAYLGAIPTEEAKQFRRALGVEWRHLPRPPLRHPDLVSLIAAEKGLDRLSTFIASDKIPRVLVGQAEMLQRRLMNFGDFLLNLAHTAAYVGDIGVGKTTAACRQAGLVLSPATAADLKGVILDTGGGRVTLCDVRIRGGDRFSIAVDPLPDEEVYRLVAEFCRSLREKDNSSPLAQADYKLPEEVERALRNMSGLARTRRKVDGKITASDPAAELAARFVTPEELRAEIASRLTLWRRTRRATEYDGADESLGRQWLKETFSSINNGRHPEFSMPGRITVTVPFSPCPGTTFKIDLIDTRGVDVSAVRPDIIGQLKDSRAVTVLCSKFNSAPDVSLQQLLNHIKETEVDPTLRSRVMILILARPGEALAMRGDDGAAAQDAREGYEIKGAHVEDALLKLGLAGIDVRFFDSSNDDPAELTQLLIKRVQALREVQADGIATTLAAVDQMLLNVKEAQALATLKEINKDLTIFAERHKSLKEKRRPVYNRLIAAVRDRHPRTVWASARRNGEFWNFDMYQHLGDGAATDAIRRSAPAIEGLREIIKNRIADRSLTSAHSFLGQLLANVDTWEADFVSAARHHAVEVYRPGLAAATELWNACEEKYGQGLDYRNDVATEIESWFEEKEALEEEVERLIHRAWRASFLQPLRKASGGVLADEAKSL